MPVCRGTEPASHLPVPEADAFMQPALDMLLQINPEQQASLAKVKRKLQQAHLHRRGSTGEARTSIRPKALQALRIELGL